MHPECAELHDMGRRKQRAVLRACGELARTAGEGSNQARSSDFGEGHDDPTTDAGTPPIVPKDNLRVAARRIRAATRHREQSDVAVLPQGSQELRAGSSRRVWTSREILLVLSRSGCAPNVAAHCAAPEDQAASLAHLVNVASPASSARWRRRWRLSRGRHGDRPKSKRDAPRIRVSP